MIICQMRESDQVQVWILCAYWLQRQDPRVPAHRAVSAPWSQASDLSSGLPSGVVLAFWRAQIWKHPLGTCKLQAREISLFWSTESSRPPAVLPSPARHWGAFMLRNILNRKVKGRFSSASSLQPGYGSSGSSHKFIDKAFVNEIWVFSTNPP